MIITRFSLVTFLNGRIEIAFNDNLDKNFIKDLSNKLFMWTNKRWVISLSKKSGLSTIKQTKKLDKNKLFEETKKSESYINIMQNLPDAKLIDIKSEESNDE